MQIQITNQNYLVEFSEKFFLKPKVVKTSDRIVVFASEEYRNEHKNILLSWLKLEAKIILIKRVEELAKQFGFEYFRITIKDQSSVWGSCSSKKNLNFSWRLILAPVEVMDYVIIHELCHLAQMNHSRNFWALVEKYMPDYKAHRKWLDKNGKSLKML